MAVARYRMVCFVLLKVIDSNIQKSVYDKSDVFRFPIIFSSGLVVMFLDYHRTVFRSSFVMLDVVLAFWMFILNSSNHFKTIDTRLQISQATKIKMGSSLDRTLNFCPNLVQYFYKDVVHMESLTRLQR